ncbi:MAG: pyruvate, phosphate dikinase [Deltaproteobacteria bacterium]|nr:pyruvate, phosphate dikinase [Deltaproteobacteria bacterium]
MTDKRVYYFGNNKAEGSASDKYLLGGKGANLHEMTNLGLPVPPGFTVTTNVCKEYYEVGERFPAGLEDEMRGALQKMEETLGRKFGDAANPLLVSVRSGAAFSMPGMMDTVLNLGLNDETAKGMAKLTNNERFVYDSYRRFIAMFGDVVLGMKPTSKHEPDPFEVALSKKKRDRGVELDSDLDGAALKELVDEYKALIRELTPHQFPQDPWQQLNAAVGAVFRSWNNPRAQTYRALNGIPSHLGTAVNVQAMVFGNMGNDCATGVAFTRDPSTGEKRFFGEYLINAQGEDVVAGIRTPQTINVSGPGIDPETTLERKMPELYRELDGFRRKLEAHYKDMQDMEFTIQEGRLWLLQTRNGKRTAPAAVRIAVEMVHEGMIDKKTAVMRVSPAQIDQLLHPMLDPKAQRTVVAKGLPASPGAATGRIVFSADEAEARGRKNERVILVRVETSPEDVHGMHYAVGILTSRGGMTSHAAVVARGMGRPCVVGCGEVSIDYASGTMTARGHKLRENDLVTLDGTTGEIMLGEVATVQAGGSASFDELMTWVDEFRRLKVRTNVDTPEDAVIARRFGAEGIGLCRTEHMFFQADRILAMREMILADSETGRRTALAKIAPMQRGDFEGIFKAMDGLPVTIRLLDPPLHEFLPHEEADIRAVADALGRDIQVVRAKKDALHEFNPMLGLRGCRLGIVHAEIYEMQVRAILEAAVHMQKQGVRVIPEIMIPLISEPRELQRLRAVVEKVAKAVFDEQSASVEFRIGTMIEIPRAALLSAEIAKHADFYSFGTNDLTQMTFGLSRDDAGSFLPGYVEQSLLDEDPFQVLDQDGVGALVKFACEHGRKAKPQLKLGICGEHGGEPKSVEFCHRTGLDYVSCSPFRVPIARMAAAQAVLRETK